MPEAVNNLRATNGRRTQQLYRDTNGRLLPAPPIALDGLPTTRAAALEARTSHYYTGLNCAHGHRAPRYATSGNCTDCQKQRAVRRRGATAKRKRFDDNTYTTGRPCIRGHVAPRRFSNGNCIECDREKYEAKYARHKGLLNERNRDRYANNPEYRTKIQAKKTPEWKEQQKRRRREQYRTDPEFREKSLASRRGRDQRNEQLKAHYGITLVDYERMLLEQGGACAICGGTATGTLHVDHDHNTGAVRGLLCRDCNRGLGCLKDNLDALRQAIKYLEKANAV